MQLFNQGGGSQKTPQAGVLENSTTAAATRTHIEDYPTLGERLCTPYLRGRWLEALRTR